MSNSSNQNLITLQMPPDEVLPTGTATGTNLIVQPTSVYERLRHLPSEVYDLSAESSITKFMKALLGDAGAGQLRKALFAQHMRSTLRGSSFYDLDRFYGPLFGMRRLPNERLVFDPYKNTATRDQWDDAHNRDASFRSRIEQFARALVYGPTPAGMELMAEALLSVDCDVYESYTQEARGSQTYNELEAKYGVNLIPDPYFSAETGAATWLSLSNLTDSRSDDWRFFDGATSLPFGGEYSHRFEVTSNASTISVSGPPGGSRFPVEGGEDYSFGFNGIVFPSSGSATRQIYARLHWFTAANGLITNVDGSWQPVESETPFFVQLPVLTAPSNAAFAAFTIYISNTVAEVGDVWHIDRIFLSRIDQTINGMQGVLYNELEGEPLPQLAGDERRVFTIRPKRQISMAESYDLRRVLNQFKPADTRLIIDHIGAPVHQTVPIGGAAADSQHWEVVPKVSSTPLPISPYQVPSQGDPVEQPRPPFTGYQGEAWSYVTNIAGVSASYRSGGENHSTPIQRFTYRDGTHADFGPQSAILPIRMVQSGRLISDAILVHQPGDRKSDNSHHFAGIENEREAVARLYMDGIRVDQFAQSLNSIPNPDPFQANPANRYWVTESRYGWETHIERLEVRLSQPSLINYLTFEVSKFPMELTVELRDDEGAEWVTVAKWRNEGSSPAYLPPGIDMSILSGHPHHIAPGHWHRVRARINPMETDRIRVSMMRIPTDYVPVVSSSNRQEVPYSLAVRSFDVGYRVSSRADWEGLGSPVIGSTRDLFGSVTQFEISEHVAELALDNNTSTAWRSEPQPVNYAVVNYYLDVRDAEGHAQVIDRLYIDPTHEGVHMSVYASLDGEDPVGDTEEFMAERTWTPIPRDYTTHKGYLHLPPTRARYLKFEFTNLAAEAYENFVPISRRIKLFPQWVIDSQLPGPTGNSNVVPGMDVAVSSASELSMAYRDAVRAMMESGREYSDSEYRPTESMWIVDPDSQSRAKDRQWYFGFSPWHQWDHAPRFPSQGRHTYDELTVTHTTKMGFFAGLREVRAYRTDFTANDDALVYLDTLDDPLNLEVDSMTWEFNPGYLLSPDAPQLPATVTSRTFISKSRVRAVQFATEQSSPSQIIPDSEFRSPSLSNYDWSDTDRMHFVGDAQLIYRANDYSVLNVRYAAPPPKPLDRTGGIVQPIHQPVWSWRPFEVADDQATAATVGGLSTPLALISDGGYVHVAVRFVQITSQTSPLILELYDHNDNLLAEKEITALKGQTVEETLSYRIESPGLAVRAQLVQRGKSSDSWAVYSLAAFDEGIVWEWTNNGGVTWTEARQIRNDANGILTFPDTGNMLAYRATAYRPNLWVSAVKIRPHYVAVGNARETGTHRGPNISFYDQDLPIHQDPMFTAWSGPVPQYWYLAGRVFPILATEGAPVVNELSRFYGRPVSESLSSTSVSVGTSLMQGRAVAESLDLPQSPTARLSELGRSISESVGEPTDEVSWAMPDSASQGAVQPIVEPIPKD